MNTRERKLKLIESIPNCPLCGAKLIIANATPPGRSALNQAAVLHDKHGLICFGCGRVEAKLRDFNKLPWKIRTRIKIDKATGIFSYLHALRKRWHKFVYMNIRGNVLKGKRTS